MKRLWWQTSLTWERKLSPKSRKHRVPYRINPRKNTPRHILIKLTKIKFKEKILKAAREKQKITYKGIPIGLSADFSVETLQARRQWQYILKVMKEKKPTTKITLPSKYLIQIQWRRQKLFRQTKAKRIQRHKTSFTTNAKETSLSGGNTREEKDTQTQTQNN